MTTETIKYVKLDSVLRDVCEREGISNAHHIQYALHHAYINEARTFHNWFHIHDVMSRAIDLNRIYSPLDINPSALWLAIFFHDIVYLPGYPGNERESAYHARHMLEVGGASPSLLTDVTSLILATENHNPIQGETTEELICDADLYGLATDKYAEHAQMIREEFGMFSDEQWRDGRIFFLLGMLGRRKIFHLPEHSELETKARDNMQKELTEMEQSCPQ